MTDAERFALRQTVTVYEDKGRWCNVGLGEAPAPWQEALRTGVRGLAGPAIVGNGYCADEWEWSDWLEERFLHG